MCGIAGIIDPSGVSQKHLAALAAALRHRGPDGEGFFLNKTGTVGLVHTRLSIVDLEGGAQPFVTRNGKDAVVANGEIYNHQEIRAHLRDWNFSSNSDCEVILPLVRRFGREALPKLRGMVAFAAWLDEAKSLLLARDLFGIKPLHYWSDGKRLAFASEVKGLLALPFVRAALNRDALWDFFNLRYLPSEETLFEGISRVPSGAVLSVTLDGTSLRQSIHSFRDGLPALSGGDGETSEADVGDAIEESVRAHLMADVPLGAYLSGGLDSSTVAHLAAKGQAGLSTFTLGFGEDQDENEAAAAFAAKIGSQHHDLRVSADLFDELPAAIAALEEPKINGVQGFVLARETSKHVKVALSGLGGDELFLGYSRNEIHYRFSGLTRWLHRMPIAGRVLENTVLTAYRGLGGIRHQHPLRGLLYLCRLGEASVADHLLRNCFDTHARELGSPFSREFTASQVGRPTLAERAEADFAPYGDDPQGLLIGAVQHELRSKLANDYLLNEDRVSMRHGLEVRVPLLDQRLFQRARGLPLDSHFECNRATKGLGTQMVSVRGKAAMRRIAARWLPSEVIERPKWGFQVSSVHHWESGIRPAFLRDVSDAWLEESGLFDLAWIHDLLSRPTDQRLSWHYYHLWMILGLRYWWDAFMARAA